MLFFVGIKFFYLVLLRSKNTVRLFVWFLLCNALYSTDVQCNAALYLYRTLQAMLAFEEFSRKYLKIDALCNVSVVFVEAIDRMGCTLWRIQMRRTFSHTFSNGISSVHTTHCRNSHCNRHNAGPTMVASNFTDLSQRITQNRTFQSKRCF